ncbi:Non-specific lipid-transfer protein 3 [Senna tora]|uniref:Non-specific lipid-transfer protein 3 n=1 Tax=Senna tora TaxID=362788 RepID=A0A834WLN7_9FABA|nr:Non-specific lipid-transfer protein 3 [Senna tora]
MNLETNILIVAIDITMLTVLIFLGGIFPFVVCPGWWSFGYHYTASFCGVAVTPVYLSLDLIRYYYVVSLIKRRQRIQIQYLGPNHIISRIEAHKKLYELDRSQQICDLLVKPADTLSTCASRDGHDSIHLVPPSMKLIIRLLDERQQTKVSASSLVSEFLIHDLIMESTAFHFAYSVGSSGGGRLPSMKPTFSFASRAVFTAMLHPKGDLVRDVDATLPGKASSKSESIVAVRDATDGVFDASANGLTVRRGLAHAPEGSEAFAAHVGDGGAAVNVGKAWYQAVHLVARDGSFGGRLGRSKWVQPH